jgi:DNA-binding GntR family transcriptional regulator
MIEKWIQLDKRRNQSIGKQLELSIYSIIMTKSFPDDYHLPHPDELAHSIQVSESDVLEAYNSLIKLNVIEHINSNYSIKKNILPTAQNYVLQAIVQSIRSIGLEPEIVHIDQMVFTSKVLNKLNFGFDEDDHVLLIKRIYTGNGHPIAYLDEYLSLKYLPGMDQINLEQFFFYPYIFETYKDTYKITREFTIDSVSKEIAQHLNQGEGFPGIHTLSKTYNSDGHLVELSDIWTVADYFKFKVDVDL